VANPKTFGSTLSAACARPLISARKARDDKPPESWSKENGDGSSRRGRYLLWHHYHTFTQNLSEESGPGGASGLRR